MGRIKIKSIKKAGANLVEATPDTFNEDFEQNKKKLGKTMPSKKVRNKVAGHITRLKKQNKNIIQEE